MEKLTDEMARRAVIEGGPFFLLGPSGAIEAANQSFCELLGYSEVEVRRLGKLKLSIDNEELEADEAQLDLLMAGRMNYYQQWLSFRNRYSNPIPGQLTTIRHPPGGEAVEGCLCWFTPMIDGSRVAVEMTVEHIKNHTSATKSNSEALAALAAAISSSIPQSKFRNMLDSVLDWGSENPKSFMSLVLLFLAMNPLPFIQNWVVRQGWMPAQPVQLQIEDKKTGGVKPVEKDDVYEYAHKIANRHSEEIDPGPETHGVSFITAAGNTIHIGGAADRPLLRAGECDRLHPESNRRTDSCTEFAIPSIDGVSDFSHRSVEEW